MIGKPIEHLIEGTVSADNDKSMIFLLQRQSFRQFPSVSRIAGKKSFVGKAIFL